jgi:hypothetical protein
MSTIALESRPRPALRPLALPTEHGGWGFLFEPIELALVVVPSWRGALVAAAFMFAFLVRQPLRLALQDAMRGKRYPRTAWCWAFACSYLFAAAAMLGLGVATAGLAVLIPIGLVAPLGLTQILYDASNRSRALLPELTGAAAMSSSAAAISIAGGMRLIPAFVLSAIIIARAIPSIVYVRTLLTRAHKKTASSWPADVLHVVAITAVAFIAPWLAVVAMAILLGRAIWGLALDPLPAKTIGWREIAFGLITVGLSAAGFVIGT